MPAYVSQPSIGFVMTHRRPTLIPLMRPVNAWLVASMITFAGIVFSGAGFNDVGFNRTASADDGNGQGAWKRHTIDDQARGADGVRLADFNGDGLADVVTGWEESGLVRLYLNPGPDRSKEPWPSVTVGKAKSPEDAVPFDVDGDGHLDVVSCHEGKQRQILVHWNPADRTGDNDTLLDASKWTTDSFEKLDGVMWMFAVPLTTADSSRTLVVGAKGSKASITLLRAPKTNPRELGTWTVARLRDAGWIMSLRSIDMDGDGDHDLVFTDRKGRARGAAWLEQPGDPMQAWPEHPIAGQQHEAMFLTATADRCMIATRNNETLDCVRSGSTWQTRKLPQSRWGELRQSDRIATRRTDHLDVQHRGRSQPRSTGDLDWR